MKKVERILYKLYVILPMLFWILIIYGLDESLMANLTVITAIVHELFHILAAAFLDSEELPYSRLDGLRLPIRKERLSYKSELIIALSGPLINLLLSLFIIYPKGTYVKAFGMINLLCALSNLIPYADNDGCRIIRILLNMCEVRYSEIILSIISAFLSAVFLLCSLYLVYVYGEGLWYVGFMLIYTIFSLEKLRGAHFSRKSEKKRDFKSF